MSYTHADGLETIAFENAARRQRRIRRWRKALSFSSSICAAIFLSFRASIVAPLPFASAADSALNEWPAKASYLAAFPNFVEWPELTFQSEKAPFLIFVVGDFSFGTALAEITRGTSVRGRSLEIRWVQKTGYCALVMSSW